jgi:hypothetical protein
MLQYLLAGVVLSLFFIGAYILIAAVLEITDRT